MNGGPGEATRRFVRWSLARGPWLWLLALALAVPSTVALVRLYRNLTSEIEELLPRKAASVAAVDELRRRLPGLSTLGVVVATSHPSELPAAERLIDDLATRVRSYPPELVRAVKIGEEAAAERRFLAAHLPLFVDVGDLVAIRKRVEERRGWDTRNRLGINLDDEEKPPPLDFSDIETKYQARFPGVRLPGAQSGAGAVTPQRNRYSDEAGTATLLLIEGRESSLGAHQARQLLERVKADIAALGGPTRYAPGLRVGFAGNIVVSVEELSALSADLGKSSALVVIAVLLVILLYFRWWAALPLLFIPLALATVVAFGLVTLPPFHVSRLNSSTGFLGSIVIGNGINFGVIWLARYVAARRRALSLEAALSEATWGALPGTLVAAVAAATAYASLTITGFRGFREFGMIGAVGMLCCWGATYLLGPSLCATIERLTGRGPPPLLREDAPGRQTTARLLAGVFGTRAPSSGWRPSSRWSRSPRWSRSTARASNPTSPSSGARHLEVGRRLLGAVHGPHHRRQPVADGDPDRQPGGGGRGGDAPAGRDDAAAARRAGGERAQLRRPRPARSAREDRRGGAAAKLFTPAVRASLPPERLAKIDQLLGTDALQPITVADLPPSLTARLRETDGSTGRVVLVYPRLTKRLWQTAQLEGFIAKLRDVATCGVPPARARAASRAPSPSPRTSRRRCSGTPPARACSRSRPSPRSCW